MKNFKGLIIVEINYYFAYVDLYFFFLSTVFKKSGKLLQVNRSDLERKNRQFTYSQVVDITKNFQRVLGEGGFGRVYHGYVGNDQVAVKMLSPSSTQGYREFQTEVCHLLVFVFSTNMHY